LGRLLRRPAQAPQRGLARAAAGWRWPVPEPISVDDAGRLCRSV
jgi:hypothetical protein